VLRSAVTEAERLHDRMVLVDLPFDSAIATVPLTTDRIISAVDSLRNVFEQHERRAAALYHPLVWLQDPLGLSAAPQRLVPASGSVAGLISRIDRERGAHHTPANAVLYDAVDVLQTFDLVDQGRLNEAGVNVIRCVASRGLAVWGGRTLDTRREGRFIAHRRLVHRLVRAIQRVAQPLVFDINGPELWLTLVRGITSVLLEAWRGGALKGARPEDAFRVKCDDETNPPEERDLGRVTCVIEVAPAVPMEFITLRVELGREGNLEVFEK
jgi:phage tail sheath protein FI